MGWIVTWFERLGTPFTTSGTEAFETLGMVYATKALLKRCRINGDILRIWLGHVVNHFRLLRPAMACLHSCYSFVQVALRANGCWCGTVFGLR